MTLDIHLFPCLSDNYGFLVRDRASGEVATVDTPDADRILQELAALGWGPLTHVFNTHWHPDHTQGNARLKAETGCQITGPAEVEGRAPIDRIVAEGDEVRLGQSRFEVLEMPGHTLGHIVYRAPDQALAFVGDVLFPLGCGRLFEGTPEQMWNSLSRLLQWPDETVIWAAHEYAQSNARFAVTVDDSPALEAHVRAIDACRERGEPTIPTRLGVERSLNPFLTAGDAQTFARRRAAKDQFKG